MNLFEKVVFGWAYLWPNISGIRGFGHTLIHVLFKVASAVCWFGPEEIFANLTFCLFLYSSCRTWDLNFNKIRSYRRSQYCFSLLFSCRSRICWLYTTSGSGFLRIMTIYFYARLLSKWINSGSSSFREKPKSKGCDGPVIFLIKRFKKKT